MAVKKVKYILHAESIDMGAIPVKQALPTHQVSHIGPYLLLHHGKFSPLNDRPAKIQGVGPHPHRGFSPVTFVVSGEVHHQDSFGNNQIAKSGDVQWLHAGAGIIHSERPTEAGINKKEFQEILQLWINSPADKKMIPPTYQYLPQIEMPLFFSKNESIHNKLIAGKYNQINGKIETVSPLLIIWGKALKKGTETYKIPTSYKSCLYLIKGNLRIVGHGKIEAESLIVFEDENNEISIHADINTQFLLLSGLSINEKIVQHGPFVMNTETEILEAMRDYQIGKMGVLIEDEIN